jgi:hypothetical protein
MGGGWGRTFKKVWKEYFPSRQSTAALDNDDDDTPKRPLQSSDDPLDIDDIRSSCEGYTIEYATESLRRRRARRVIDSDDDKPISTLSRSSETTSTTSSHEHSTNRITREMRYMSVENPSTMPGRTTPITPRELFAAHKSVEVVDLTSNQSYTTATQSGSVSSLRRP